MRRKRLLKALAELLKRPIFKVFLYVGGMALILGLSGAFHDGQTVWNTFYNIIKSEETLSLLFAGLMSLGALKILSWFESYMEESMKIEDNHHKIIAQYEKHNPFSTARKKKMREVMEMEKNGQTVTEDAVKDRIRDEITERNKSTFADKDGEFLTLSLLKNEVPERLRETDKISLRKSKRLPERKECWRKRKLKQLVPEKGTEGKEYDRSYKSAARYLDGKLDICSLNMFANISGKTKMVFDDHTQEHTLPSFVIDHADELLQAHKNSQKKNSNTVRLNDFTYDKGTDRLILDTGRSTYYHMLITNRCMDYQFANGLSIRETYEYDDHICPLERSKFGNQIGINGLIVTSDGYVLVEKRGRKKITWKNKFAQCISLAMKLDDLEMSRWDKLGAAPEDAQEKIEGIIKKTIKGNFGLVPKDDYEVFQMEHNFLGLARDLLEGGKPNLYFFIYTKQTGEELRNTLVENLKKRHPDGRYVITDSKLDSDYYLMPFDQIAIDFRYCMFAKRKEILRVHRKVAERCGWPAEAWDRIRETVNRIIRPTLKRECGEALLVTLSYMELCNRWREPREKGTSNEQ